MTCEDISGSPTLYTAHTSPRVAAPHRIAYSRARLRVATHPPTRTARAPASPLAAACLSAKLSLRKHSDTRRYHGHG